MLDVGNGRAKADAEPRRATPVKVSEADDQISRRRLLSLVSSGVAAAAVSTHWSFRVVEGAVVQEPAEADAAWTPVLFTREEGVAVARLAEALIPRTDTPGAIDAKVPEYLDLSLSLESDAVKNRFRSGLEAFGSVLRSETKTTVDQATNEQLRSVLEMVSDQHDQHPENLRDAAGFFSNLKQRVVFGYYTSLEGRTQELGLPARVQRTGLQGCDHESLKEH